MNEKSIHELLERAFCTYSYSAKVRIKIRVRKLVNDMTKLRELSTRQRVKRRICLLAGSYKYPDGYVERNFEVAAGINPEDSISLREAKLTRYAFRRRASRRFVSAVLTGFSIFLLARFLDASFWHSVVIASPMALGLHGLTSPTT